jgi:hypothetical protein
MSVSIAAKLAVIGPIAMLWASTIVHTMNPNEAYSYVQGNQPRINYYVCPVCPLCQDSMNNMNLPDFQQRCAAWNSAMFTTYASLSRQCQARYKHNGINKNSGKWRDDCACRNQDYVYGMTGQCSDTLRLSANFEAYDTAHDKLKANAVKYNNLLLDLEALRIRYHNVVSMTEYWNAAWDKKAVENAKLHMANISEQNSVYHNPIYLSLPHIENQNAELMALFSNTSYTSLSAWVASYKNTRLELIGDGNGSIPTLIRAMVAKKSLVRSENATISIAADIESIRTMLFEVFKKQETIRNSSFVAAALAYRVNATEFIGQAEALLQTKILALTRNQAALKIRFAERTNRMVTNMRAVLDTIGQEQLKRGCPAPQPLSRMIEHGSIQ